MCAWGRDKERETLTSSLSSSLPRTIKVSLASRLVLSLIAKIFPTNVFGYTVYMQLNLKLIVWLAIPLSVAKSLVTLSTCRHATQRTMECNHKHNNNNYLCYNYTYIPLLGGCYG